jgi:4-hydroxy-tetrahydrodipicolinate reductase
MKTKIKVIMYGIGSIGSRIAETVLSKGWLEVVAAIDISPQKTGKDLGEVLGMDRRTGVTVRGADEVIPKVKADVVVHSTSSRLVETYPQIAQCIEAGLNVVSTCEELSFPRLKHPELSAKLDAAAKKNGVAILGTGINPGFIMDTLPIVLTAPCVEVHGIKVTRMMYSGDRRDSYQKKIGTGMTAEEFRGMIDRKEITGHVGLEESIAMIASAMNWKLDRIAVLPPEPVLASEELKTAFTKIKPNHVCGLKSVAHGIVGGRRAIVLEFVSHAKVKRPYDAVRIRGIPDILEKITGGVNGDLGTIGCTVNAIPRLLEARPGLATMLDIALPRYGGGSRT